MRAERQWPPLTIPKQLNSASAWHVANQVTTGLMLTTCTKDFLLNNLSACAVLSWHSVINNKNYPWKLGQAKLIYSLLFNFYYATLLYNTSNMHEKYSKSWHTISVDFSPQQLQFLHLWCLCIVFLKKMTQYYCIKLNNQNKQRAHACMHIQAHDACHGQHSTGHFYKFCFNFATFL